MTNNESTNDGRAHGSNLTSRFGLNDNVARPEDAGHTVVGGAFGDQHTGDAYTGGQPRELEGRGTTGEHFGEREGLQGVAAGHQGLGAGHEHGQGHGKEALAGAAVAGAGAEHHHSHHQGHHERQEHAAHHPQGQEGGIKGIIPAGAHGFDNSAVNHHGKDDPATGVPLSGQHHGNHHGVPGLPGDELGAPAAPVGTSHGATTRQGELSARSAETAPVVGAGQGMHGGPAGQGMVDPVAPGGGMIGQGVAPPPVVPAAVPTIKEFPRAQGGTGHGILGHSSAPLPVGTRPPHSLASANGLTGAPGMAGAQGTAMAPGAEAPGAGVHAIKEFPHSTGGSGNSLGAGRI